MGVDFPDLHLGPLRIGLPLTQAALSGYSDWPMRVIARRLGASYTLCEVLLDQFVVQITRGSRATRFLRATNEEHPSGAQLMGNTPEDFPPAAKKLVEAGFDCIDLNFACPVKKVLSRRRGGYLLGRPDVALEIVARVRDAVPSEIPVTVKMRRGIDGSDAAREQFFTIFDGAFALGVAAVTVHPRTVAQRYEGRSSWEFLREVKHHASGKTVLGSGDLFTAEDCVEMMRQTGVDGVVIARGAIGNPWIFEQTRALFAGRPLPAPPSLHAQREVIAEHYRMSEAIYGWPRFGRQMRKFGIKYSQLHPHQDEVRAAFVAVRKPDELRQVLDRWYAEDLPGRYPPRDRVAEP